MSAETTRATPAVTDAILKTLKRYPSIRSQYDPAGLERIAREAAREIGVHASTGQREDPILDTHQCQINPATMRCFRCGLLYKFVTAAAASRPSDSTGQENK